MVRFTIRRDSFVRTGNPLTHKPAYPDTQLFFRYVIGKNINAIKPHLKKIYSKSYTVETEVSEVIPFLCYRNQKYKSGNIREWIEISEDCIRDTKIQKREGSTKWARSTTNQCAFHTRFIFVFRSRRLQDDISFHIGPTLFLEGCFASSLCWTVKKQIICSSIILKHHSNIWVAISCRKLHPKEPN